MIDRWLITTRDAARQGLLSSRADRLHNLQRERDRLALWQARFDIARAAR